MIGQKYYLVSCGQGNYARISFDKLYEEISQDVDARARKLRQRRWKKLKETACNKGR